MKRPKKNRSPDFKRNGTTFPDEPVGRFQFLAILFVLEIFRLSVYAN